MCLILKCGSRQELMKYNPEPKVATKEFKVYKVLSKNGTSPYRGFKWEQGQHYYQTRPLKVVKPRDCYRAQVKEGLYCCSTRNACRKHLRITGLKIVEMYIPKGAHYYEADGEIVTDNLIWY